MSSSADNAAGVQDDMPAVQRRSWLAAILVAATGLRVYRLDWGLPEFIFNDTRIHFVEAAAHVVAKGDWILDRFVHPPLYPYLLSIVTLVSSILTGREVHLIGPESQADMAWIVLIGRATTAALGTVLVGTIYLLARRLVGTRAALFAAAFFAISPLHVIESHRINVDTPMLILAVLSAHQAIVAFQQRQSGRLLVSFALAAAAGAVKYTGLFAGTLPIWVALRWPVESWPQRAKFILYGGLASAAAFLICMSPVLLNWSTFVRNIQEVFYIGIFHGAPGQNLTGDSFVYAPYLYLLFVGLPFVLGWAVLLASIAGVPVLLFSNRRALALIAAAALPFFLLQGAAETATARYYFPLAPSLVITAGAFAAWSIKRLPRLGTALVIGILAYSTVLTVSQVQRIGGAPQAAIARDLHLLTEAKKHAGISLRSRRQPKLVIGYPYWASSLYDALYPEISSNDDRRLVYFPKVLRFPGDALPAEEALEGDREWIDRHGVDVIIVTSRWENLKARKSFRDREAQFYQHLIKERLGLRRAAHYETSYFTQSWYEWADPTLDTIFTAGIAGYQLYVRDDLVSALPRP